jgi:SAM-dependent methyltransferase
MNYESIEQCRSCGSPDLVTVLPLGDVPLADALLEQADAPEDRYPLTLAFCLECSLVQILETVPADVLFGADYPYFSSFSDALLRHSRDHVESLIESRNLDSDSLVVELASNDGYLLRHFVEKGVPVLGVDPTPGPAAAAREIGVPTMERFFTLDFADELVQDGVRADVIIGNNVLAHVTDQNDFVAGIRRLLQDDGVAVLEFPYVKDLVDHCEFDTIYHEHACYFSVTSVRALFARHGLHLIGVEHLTIHGGSLRITASPTPVDAPTTAEFIRSEQESGVDSLGYYTEFGARVERLRTDLRALLADLHERGAAVAGYGAAAKGTGLLSYCGIGGNDLSYIADRNVHKQGKYMPGARIEIVPPSRIDADPPDYLLILPWNFADEIRSQQDGFRDGGGRFIIPVPEPVIVS